MKAQEHGVMAEHTVVEQVGTEVSEVRESPSTTPE